MDPKKFKTPLLLGLNTYFLWFVIQTVRSIPVLEDPLIILVIIFAVALLVDLCLQRFFRSIIIVKASYIIFTVFSIILLIFDDIFFFTVIILSYCLFIPGFFAEMSNEKESTIKNSILIGLSCNKPPLNCFCTS